MKRKTIQKRRFLNRHQRRVFMGVALIISQVERTMAQDGGRAGLEEATNMITGYFDPGVKLVYAIGMLCGLIGGLKVFSKVQGGDPDAGKSAGLWFAGCVFLVVTATVLKSFFR